MTDLPTRILDAALPAIVFDGWTLATLEKAAESIGLTAFAVIRDTATKEQVGKGLSSRKSGQGLGPRHFRPSGANLRALVE